MAQVLGWLILAGVVVLLIASQLHKWVWWLRYERPLVGDALIDRIRQEWDTARARERR